MADQINPAYAVPVEAHVASLGEKVKAVAEFLKDHQSQIEDILLRLVALEQAVEKKDK